MAFLDGIASPASFVIMTFDFVDQLLHFDKRRFSQFCTGWFPHPVVPVIYLIVKEYLFGIRGFKQIIINM